MNWLPGPLLYLDGCDLVVERKRVKVLRPETDEVIVIKSDEELHRLFEELKRESEAYHRGYTKGSVKSQKT